MTVNTFARLPGDHAGYSLGDAAAAVELSARSSVVAVDIETAGLGVDAWEVKALALGTASRAVVLDPGDARQAAAFRDAVAQTSRVVVHNSCFDVPILVASGLMRSEDVWKVEDTLVTARLADPGERVSKSLGAACERYLGDGYGVLKGRLTEGFKAVTGLSKSQTYKVLGLSSPAYVAYAAFDIIMTARLYEVLFAAVAERLSAHPFPTSGDAEALVEREQTVNRVLLARSCTGIEIDFDVVDELKGELARRIVEADGVLGAYGIDTSLSREKVKAEAVAELDRRGLLPPSHKRLKNGQPSAAKQYLEQLSHPIVDAITMRSQADRFVSDYADKLVHLSHDGRIHPQVAVMVATTGRMSYSEPPLQQFPALVRRMMKFDVPATSMDWASIEPVYFANVTGDLERLAVFEAGGDLYLPVADAAGVDRKTAKTILLAQLYGQGMPGLSMKLGVSEAEARRLVEEVLGRMPKIRQAIGRIRGVGDRLGLVQTLSGRIIPLDRDLRTGGRSYVGYKGVNYVVQGSCYDLLSEAVYAVHQAGLSDALLAAVHDELVVATDAADDVQKIMQTPPPAFVEAAGRVPVLRVGRADLGRHWMPKDT